MMRESIKGNSPEILPPGSRILFVSDFADGGWNQNNSRKPLISGINTFSDQITTILEKKGYQVDFVHPFITDSNKSNRRIFHTTPIPFYKTIEIAFGNPMYVNEKVKELLKKKPNGVFIATVEGMLGLTTMLACRRLDIPYTLAFTTNFSEYFSTYIAKSTHNLLKPSPDILQTVSNLLYRGANHILVPTSTMQSRFKKQGFSDTTVWPRGINANIFRPPKEGDKNPYEQLYWYKKEPLPILLNVGRVGADKNIPDFLNMTDESIFQATRKKFHKVIIGDGPQLEEYKRKYENNHVHFLGSYPHDQVSSFFRFARLFVFPSTKDTFGNVIIEAGASGTPVLAYSGYDGSNEIGSQDSILDGKNGIKIQYGTPLVDGLSSALSLNRQICSESTVKNFSWETSFRILLENLTPIKWKN